MFTFFRTAILVLFPFLGNCQTLKLPKVKHNFVVIAHRGNHQHAPENTIKSLKDAIRIDADYVEIDLRTTRDGQLINMHDASLIRMTGLDKNVKETDFEQIKALKVTDKYHPEFGEHAIPTFEEILHLCHNKINIYLDFKEADVKTTYEKIVKHKMEESVVVYINSKAQFDDWRKIAPTIPLMISLPEKVISREGMREILKKYKCDILDGNYKEYNFETVKEAKLAGVPVWADIQSNTENQDEWSVAIEKGISGLQSDNPEGLIKYLRKLNSKGNKMY